MTVVGTGTISGNYAGIKPYEGSKKVKFVLVHLDTLDGAAVFIAKKDVWDKHYKHLKLGNSLVVQYSVVETKDTGHMYVLERIVGLE